MTRCTRCSSERSDLTVFCSHCGFPHEPKFDQLLNTLLSGRYLLRDRLGEGGLSTVFLATDTHTEQEVVIKISDPRQIVQQAQHVSVDATTLRQYWDEMIERMRREVIALVSVQHPHIVRILDTDRITDELRYIVMERLHGRTLREELSARGRFSLRETIQMAEAICSGLSVIHQRGIIHRDLNPRNLFIADGEAPAAGLMRTADYGRTDFLLQFESAIELTASASDLQAAAVNPQSAIIKIIDFGIARLPQPPGAPPFTQYAVLSGTVSYASPEQCQNQPLDHRSDIYSLGVVLYEMLTGQRPFTGLSPTEVAVRQIRDEPVNPRLFASDLPTSVEVTLLRSLAKDPDKRQQSVEELAAELRPYRQGVSARVVVPINAVAEAPVGEAAAILSEISSARVASVEVALDEPPAELKQLSSNDAAQAETQTPEPASEFVTRLPEPEFKTFNARPRRAVAAIAATLALLLLTGFLFGEEWLNHLRVRVESPPAQTDLIETASLPQAEKPAPTGVVETARNAAQRFGNTLLNSVRRVATQSSGNDSTQNSPAVSPDISGRGAMTETAAITTTTAPPPTRPQMPPAPAPTIAAAREVPPASNPSNSRGPVREPVPQDLPNESSTIPAQRERQIYSRPEPPPTPRAIERSSDDSTDDSTDRHSRQNDSRSPRSDDETWHRREPDRRNEPREEAERQPTQPRVEDVPKVITWSGVVNEEREIRLELPGTPGNINIPRAYRKRVGLVEPPGPQNGWRSVVLRVFGKGHTSIVVQWWPRPVQFTRSAGDFFNRRVISPVNQASRTVAQQFSRIRK